MKIMYISGSCWMRDDEGNLKPFNRNSDLERLFTSFGDELIYPEIYWYEGDYLFPYLERIVEKEKVELIIGYSAGGYIGFHLCNKYKIKGIHFNPAIAPTSEAPTLQILPNDYKNIPIFSDQIIVIGEEDRLSIGGVDGHLVYEYLERRGFIEEGEVIIIPKIKHAIPFNIFKMIFEYFKKNN